jgi:capsular polysaccharide biosynthesis protein
MARTDVKTGRDFSFAVQWWWIALLGAALAIVLLLESAKPPVYRATSTLVVIPPNEASLKSLARTYAEMAVRPVVLQRVSEMLGRPMSTEYLAGLVTARPVPDTLLVAIAAEVEDAALARDIANATGQAFLDQLGDMATPDPAAPSVRMGQPATTPDRPVGPNPVNGIPVNGILMGVIAALVLGVTVIEALRRISSRPRAIPRSHLARVS